MCGICGSSGTDAEAFVEKAIPLLTHRGPDAHGRAGTASAVFGHTRLAIVDIAQSQQPMLDGTACLVFNGEVYNFRELRAALGGEWRTAGDTEVVLRLLSRMGMSALSLLDGMFALAYDDGEDLYLARDPVGIKPLYFSSGNGGVCFASELKALVGSAQDLRELPPGCWWSQRKGLNAYPSILKEAFKRSIVEKEETADIQECIRETLRRGVMKRLIADPGVPVGVFLSGGLDSSLIAALAKEVRDTLETFVVGMEGSEDVEHSMVVAKALGTVHRAYRYTFQEMLEALPKVIYHLESYDAALVRSAIPNFFLSRLASERVKVVLTGEGADELFGGYEYMRGLTDPEVFQRELGTCTANLYNTNLQRTDRMTMAFGLEGRVPFLDLEMIRLALSLAPETKFHEIKGMEKDLLRQAFRSYLPDEILFRPKAKFSQGAGSQNLLTLHAEHLITDMDFREARLRFGMYGLRSKEELLYLRIFLEQFGTTINPNIVGRTRSVVQNEL